MPHFKRIIVSSIIAAVAVIAAPRARGQDGALDMCSAEIAEVVSSALEHALRDARDLPDLGLVVRQSGPIRILNSLREQQCRLSDAVLPTSAEEMYVLVGREDLVGLASQTGDSIAFVIVDNVRIRGGESRLWLGVSMQQVPGDERPLLCCCHADLVLRRDAGRWEYFEWGGAICG